MGHTVSKSKARTRSDEVARAGRARHVANALASVRMEGLEPHPDILSLADRYIEGELTLEDFGSRIEAFFINRSPRA